MKDSYTSANRDDFGRRYRGTYGRYTKTDGSKITVYVAELSDYEVTCQTVDGYSFSANIDSGVEFEFYPLNRRLTDWNGQILCSTRRPDRQWSRGVCNGNTRIINLCKYREISVDHRSVDAIYNSEQVPSNSYTEFLKGKRDNFLLSDKFAVISGDVYIYDKVIGSHNKAKLELCVNPLFAQEVKDAVSRNNLELKVSINEHN